MAALRQRVIALHDHDAEAFVGFQVSHHQIRRSDLVVVKEDQPLVTGDWSCSVAGGSATAAPRAGPTKVEPGRKRRQHVERRVRRAIVADHDLETITGHRLPIQALQRQAQDVGPVAGGDADRCAQLTQATAIETEARLSATARPTSRASPSESSGNIGSETMDAAAASVTGSSIPPGGRYGAKAGCWCSGIG